MRCPACQITADKKAVVSATLEDLKSHFENDGTVDRKDKGGGRKRRNGRDDRKSSAAKDARGEE